MFIGVMLLGLGAMMVWKVQLAKTTKEKQNTREIQQSQCKGEIRENAVQRGGCSKFQMSTS